MKKLLSLCFVLLLITSCHKHYEGSCNIQEVYSKNAKKVTITSGVWGTIGSMEGDCMPSISATRCKTCPVKRSIRFYEYTKSTEATPQNSNGFYDSFSTQLIKEIETDGSGFYQTDIPAGTYTMIIVENGKLYAIGTDGLGGLNPVTITGSLTNIDLTMTYKAVF